MLEDRIRSLFRNAISELSREFDCSGHPRRVFDRIESTLDGLPTASIEHVLELDAATNGAVAALIRARLLLIVAGASRDCFGAKELFAEIEAVSQDRWAWH